MKLSHFADWMPIRIYWQQGQPMVDWGYLGAQRFVDPFFDDTINHCLRQPFSLLFRHQTPITALAELETIAPGVPPTGFIFHMSRCGSTLTAQTLAALAQHIVISEAAPIDTVLRAHWRDPQIDDAQRIAWLRSLLSAYGRPRFGERHFFIKFDSWHTLELPLIQRAFPEVPWIFLFREPVEVLVSQQRQPGSQMVPGLLPPAWFGLDWVTLGETPPDEYWARVLARICASVLQNLNAKACLINYHELPIATWTTIAAHFGLAPTDAERQCMSQIAQFDAKNPSMFFAEDKTSKRNAASERLVQVAEQWLMPQYAALETHRQARF